MFDFLRVAASRLRSVLRLRRMDDDFQRELDSHLALMTDENVRRGMPRDQAERAARLRLGGFTQLRETNRELHGLPVIETFAQDLRYAWRVLRKNPVFTLIAVVTLALGIGANTAIFSVVNAVFLRPLPFPHSDRIFVVRRVGNRIGGASLSMPIYLAWQQQAAPVLERLAMVAWRGSATLSGSGDPAPLPSSGASTDLFPLLGVHPALGRDFRPEEGGPGGPHVVILSDRLWRARFAADPNILGRDLTLDGASYTVVGVMPPSFSVPLPGLDDTALWFPIQVPLASDNPSNGGLLCLGLLRAGATPQQAEAALTPPLSALHDRFPSMFTPGERVRLDPLRNFITSRAGTAPLLLFGAVMLVLLLACVNVANLLLAAGTVRAQEMALRAALGATRRRIVRQLLTESVLLSFVGGALGVAACYALFGGVVRLIPAFTPHVGDFRMDGVVLGFAVALSVLTGVLFGLVPALGASSVDLNGVLKTAGSRAASRGHSGLRRALAANEIALALVLLVGAALALQSLARLMNVQPGFDPSNVLTFQLSLPRSQYPTPEQRQAFFDQALSRFSSLPGIERAGAANLLPFVGGNDNLFTIEDGPSRTSDVKLAADIRIVSPDFFATLRIPQARGRMFSSADRPGTLPVAILNREAAREYWPQGEPVGTHVWIGKPMGPANAEPAPRQIVGIVGDIHESSLASPPEPTIYIPLAQVPSADSPFYAAFFLLRTTRDPLASVPDVRSAVRSLDPAMPMERLHTMDDILAASVQDWRFRAVLLGAFGALALLIAAIGVYGVISYSVAQRTREIGVRVALGATRRNVLGLVLRHGMITALVGILIGLAAALALTRLMASLLFGIDARDPLTFLAVAFLLALVALAACYLPARRAMHVEPMTALRYE